MGDAIPDAKALSSVDCLNGPESTCANKQAVRVEEKKKRIP